MEGIKTHVLGDGDGTPIVLLHAGASSGRQWRKVATGLASHRMIAPDLYGFGETAPWPGPEPLSHDHQAALVRRTMESFGAVPAHVVGHSYGGATAIRLALSVPSHLLSLTVIEPIAMPLLREAGELDLFESYRAFAQRFIDDADAGREEGAWRTFIDLRNGDGTWQRMEPAQRERLVAGTAPTAQGFASNLANPTSLADCARITVPTLAVLGQSTTQAERRVTEIVAHAIRGCRLEEIPGAEHMSPITHAEAVAALICAHVDEVDRGR